MPTSSYLLILDDDADDRSLFLGAFRDRDPHITVKEASDARATLSFFEKCADHLLPAVLLLDYQMPDLTGPEVLEVLQRNGRYAFMAKVMWSTSKRTKDIDDCKRLGASHYLFKPCSDAELAHVVGQVRAIFEHTVHNRKFESPSFA